MKKCARAKTLSRPSPDIVYDLCVRAGAANMKIWYSRKVCSASYTKAVQQKAQLLSQRTSTHKNDRSTAALCRLAQLITNTAPGYCLRLSDAPSGRVRYVLSESMSIELIHSKVKLVCLFVVSFFGTVCLFLPDTFGDKRRTFC